MAVESALGGATAPRDLRLVPASERPSPAWRGALRRLADVHGRRIGILGGTFDPPHNGHVVVAAEARHALDLDEVLVLPANVPWQKVGTRGITPADDRLAMTRLAMADLEAVRVSTLELERGGSTYTADTLEQLSALAPDDERFLLVGSDVAPGLDTWKRPEVVRRLATLVVYDRPGSAGAAPPPAWPCARITVAQVSVSSTELRERVRAGRPIDGLVPPAVVRYIRSRRLYLDDEPSGTPTPSPWRP